MNDALNSAHLEEMRKGIKEARGFLLSQLDTKPSIGIISGTGFDDLKESFTERRNIPADSIPHFPSVDMTDRSFVLGRIENHYSVMITKRLHRYEGFTMLQIAMVIRIMKEIGVDTLIITNAAGGLNPLYSPGEIMLITDHINLMGDSPLRGPNLDEYGPRFPDLTAPYDPGLIQIMEKTALSLGLRLWKGVYAGISGPNLETRAETRFLKAIGADAVGMSTVPEVITAIHCGMRVLGLSVLSNINLPDCPKVHTLEGIVSVVKQASPLLLKLLKGFLAKV